LETNILKKDTFNMKFIGSKNLPSLEFNEDEGILKIYGRSIEPEADEDFWKPLRDKIDEYLDDPKNIILSIDLEYFATSSSKAMHKLFKMFQNKNVIKNKKEVLINWYYEDEDIFEAGEDYKSMFPKINWKFIKKIINDEDSK